MDPAALTAPVAVGGRTAPSAVVLGPHVTNLAAETAPRALGVAHVAHYRARAEGGAGIVVTEVASVHDSDHPYERAPRAAECGEGWAAVAAACRPHGTLVVAGLGHAGAQGTAAHHRRALWAPAAVPDVVVGETPVAMSDAQVDEIVAGFAAAARLAVDAGCDGVEVQAGQHALLRQFRSGLSTPEPSPAVGRRVLDAVRDTVGDALVGVRLGVDELAPWAGITPEDGVAEAVRLAGVVDYVVPVRGSGMSVAATRPDGHTEPGFLRETCARVRAAVDGRAAVVLAGSVVDPADAAAARAEGTADLVEMTRAQLADPHLVRTLRAGRAPRPCVLTNQECRARDVRNPRVSCTVNPDVEPDAAPVVEAGAVTVVGAGPAGLEAARVLAAGGAAVTLHERAAEPGGLLPVIARLPGHARFGRLLDWWCHELDRLGVDLRCASHVPLERANGALTPLERANAPFARAERRHAPRSACSVVEASGAAAAGGRVIWATGGVDGPAPDLGAVPVLSARAVLTGADPGTGPVAVLDPLGDSAGVGTAEVLAARGLAVALVTPDPVCGTLLARRGDLVDASARLQRAGVDRVLESEPVAAGDGVLHVRDTATGAPGVVPAALLVDAGPRRPGAVPDDVIAAGDVIAPRTVHEAVREGRRAAAAVSAWS